MRYQFRRWLLKWYRFSDPVLGKFRRRWRSSLALRLMTITGVITFCMIALAGAFILSSVREDLNSTKLNAALQDSARSTTVAQQLIDSTEATDREALASLMLSVRAAIRDTSSSPAIYVRREPGQDGSTEAPLNFRTSEAVPKAVTAELSEQIITAEEPQLWQYVSLETGPGEAAPGIIVGTTLTFPGNTGNYNLFIAYSFAETKTTLDFIAQTLILTGVVLILFIGLLVWSMSRIVFKPISMAAQVSRRLAEGETDARMKHQNDHNFDELSDNFNQMADTLNARIKELDTLSTMQQRFVSDVSHELRTPLTTIRLAAEVLNTSDEQVPAGQQRAARVLTEQVTRFERLLEDLLEISRYDAGRVQIETEPTNLVSLCQEVVADLQPLSESIIEVRPLGGYSAIDVDPRRIRRIISNLVGNAIEHGEGNPIIVTIDSNTTAYAIAVRDYGIGMNEIQAERVFDRFYRADPSRKRTLGGTGLGLAIAQEDAAVHGGVIELWSEPNVGSNFRLTLPRSDSFDSFLSPLPLVPEDVTGTDASQTVTDWVKRPSRWLLRRGDDGKK